MKTATKKNNNQQTYMYIAFIHIQHNCKIIKIVFVKMFRMLFIKHVFQYLFSIFMLQKLLLAGKSGGHMMEFRVSTI